MMTSENAASVAPVDLSADHHAYFHEKLLPKAARATSLTDKEVTQLMGWAKLVDMNMARMRVGPHGDKDDLAQHADREARTALIKTMLNNERLPQSCMDRLLKLREEELGFPDADLRAVMRQRRDLRRVLVTVETAARDNRERHKRAEQEQEESESDANQDHALG